jgi:hypothetical protein
VSTDTTAVVHPDSDEGRARIRHRRLTAWVTFAMLALVIGSALADGADVIDVWGVDDDTVEARSADGAVLTVRYPNVTRPALASPFAIEVHQPGGFDDDVELAIDLRYLELWDLNGVYPSPSDERSEGDRIVWTFAAPDGDTLAISIDARVEPGAQLERRDGAISLLDAGTPVATARFTTSVRP